MCTASLLPIALLSVVIDTNKGLCLHAFSGLDLFYCFSESCRSFSRLYYSHSRASSEKPGFNALLLANSYNR
ncbi:hypothetical protein V8C44DRAFT_207644 [Trichoderma aethiopicum]